MDYFAGRYTVTKTKVCGIHVTDNQSLSPTRTAEQSKIDHILQNSLIISQSRQQLETKLDTGLLSISQVSTKRSGKDEALKKSAPEQNLSGYRPGDEQLVNYWEVKRHRPLGEMFVSIEVEGELKVITADEVYQLTEVCLLPYLVFSDLGTLRQLKEGFEGLPSPKQIQRQLDLVYLKKISDDVGWGLFAKAPIKNGVVIGEYTGVVRESQSGGSYCMEYVTVSGQSMVIDAKYFGNHTRFVNHSDQPNLEVVEKRAIPAGYSQILFKATKDIAAHEQLVVDYGDQYWGIRKPVDLDTHSL